MRALLCGFIDNQARGYKAKTTRLEVFSLEARIYRYTMGGVGFQKTKRLVEGEVVTLLSFKSNHLTI